MSSLRLFWRSYMGLMSHSHAADEFWIPKCFWSYTEGGLTAGVGQYTGVKVNTAIWGNVRCRVSSLNRGKVSLTLKISAWGRQTYCPQRTISDPFIPPSMSVSTHKEDKPGAPLALPVTDLRDSHCSTTKIRLSTSIELQWPLGCWKAPYMPSMEFSIEWTLIRDNLMFDLWDTC